MCEISLYLGLPSVVKGVHKLSGHTLADWLTYGTPVGLSHCLTSTSNDVSIINGESLIFWSKGILLRLPSFLKIFDGEKFGWPAAS